MDEQPKVFVITFRYKTHKLEYLALQPNPEPGRNTDPYVVTGGVDVGEKVEAAVQREVEEEIGVRPAAIIDLRNEIRYQDHITGGKYVEYCYRCYSEAGTKIGSPFCGLVAMTSIFE